jgi:hypothetical protein
MLDGQEFADRRSLSAAHARRRQRVAGANNGEFTDQVKGRDRKDPRSGSTEGIPAPATWLGRHDAGSRWQCRHHHVPVIEELPRGHQPFDGDAVAPDWLRYPLSHSFWARVGS